MNSNTKEVEILTLINMVNTSANLIKGTSDNSIEWAIQAGKALLELKVLVASKGKPYHKRWGDFVKDNFQISYRQIGKYSLVAKYARYYRKYKKPVTIKDIGGGV